MTKYRAGIFNTSSWPEKGSRRSPEGFLNEGGGWNIFKEMKQVQLPVNNLFLG